jgi:hypothetical protein
MKPNHIAAVLVIGAFLALGGCAVETPRLYVQIPKTPYSAYVYGGAGIAATPDATPAGN